MIEFAYQVRWRPRAFKDLTRLPERDKRRVIEAVQRFATSGDGDVSKLTGVRPPEYRLRVGTYRVRFHRDEPRRILTVLRVLPRDKAYQVREPGVDFTTEEVLEAGIA